MDTLSLHPPDKVVHFCCLTAKLKILDANTFNESVSAPKILL